MVIQLYLIYPTFSCLSVLRVSVSSLQFRLYHSFNLLSLAVTAEIIANVRVSPAHLVFQIDAAFLTDYPFILIPFWWSRMSPDVCVIVKHKDHCSHVARHCFVFKILPIHTRHFLRRHVTQLPFSHAVRAVHSPTHGLLIPKLSLSLNCFLQAIMTVQVPTLPSDQPPLIPHTDSTPLIGWFFNSQSILSEYF